MRASGCGGGPPDRTRGHAKIPAVVQTLIARGLVRIVQGEDGKRPRAQFTDAGFRALVEMADDARAFQPRERYSHLLTEIAELRGSSDG